MANIDEEGNLITGSGKKLPELVVGATMFIDRTIVVYGPSKTGKTVITKHIMSEVKGHIEQVIVIAPSEPSNQSYVGIVDDPFIHYRLYLQDPANPKKDIGVKGGLRFLDAVWQRQEMAVAMYNRANNSEVLSLLFGRLSVAERAEGLRLIKSINDKREGVIEKVRKQYDNPNTRDPKIKSTNDKFKKMLALIYKKYITPNYAALWARDDLSEDEQYSLYYLNFNPRMLLIFDDCAAQLKPYFNTETFRKIFYQNRHVFITAIVCCQDDTDLPANLRKNAFISFFTEPVVCLSNFERTSNKFPKPTKAYVNEIIADVFSGHRKLAYIREDDRRQHFYHVQFPYPKPFRFGSEAAHELCDIVHNSGVTMDKENPFYDRFKI